MQSEQELIDIFNKLDKKYIGQAMRIAIIYKDVSLNTLAQKLRIRRSLIKEIIKGSKEISFQFLKDFCIILNVPLEMVLKAAVFLREQENREKNEILQEIVDEAEFYLWKMKQKDQE